LNLIFVESNSEPQTLPGFYTPPTTKMSTIWWNIKF